MKGKKDVREKKEIAVGALMTLIADWRKRARTLRRRGLLASAQAYETQADELEREIEQPKVGHD